MRVQEDEHGKVHPSALTKSDTSKWSVWAHLFADKRRNSM